MLELPLFVQSLKVIFMRRPRWEELSPILYMYKIEPKLKVSKDSSLATVDWLVVNFVISLVSVSRIWLFLTFHNSCKILNEQLTENCSLFVWQFLKKKKNKCGKRQCFYFYFYSNIFKIWALGPLNEQHINLAWP